MRWSAAPICSATRLVTSILTTNPRRRRRAAAIWWRASIRYERQSRCPGVPAPLGLGANHQRELPAHHVLDVSAHGEGELTHCSCYRLFVFRSKTFLIPSPAARAQRRQQKSVSQEANRTIRSTWIQSGTTKQLQNRWYWCTRAFDRCVSWPADAFAGRFKFMTTSAALPPLPLSYPSVNKCLATTYQAPHLSPSLPPSMHACFRAKPPNRFRLFETIF